MEISNKTLAIVLVAAIAISLFGTVLSIDRIGRLGKLQQPTTGYATGTGRAELNISTTASIRFILNTINWSTGSVNSTAYFNCTLATNSLHSSGCVGFNTVNDSLILENDGSTILSTVQIKSDSSNATFPGGSLVYGGPQFMWNVSDNESNSCGTLTGPTAWVDVNVSGGSPGTLICQGLDFLDGNDTMKVGLYVNIPYTATSGVKQAILTATGS